MICKNCGYEFEPGNFCPNCGVAVEKEAKITEEVIYQEPVNEAPMETVEEVQEPVQTAEIYTAPTYTEQPVQPPVYSQPGYQQQTVPGNINTAHPDIALKLKEVFSDKLFLAFAILISAAAVISTFSGAVQIFYILFTIASWLIYGTAKSGKQHFKTVGLKMFSGTVKACFIVIWVAIGIIGVCSLIMIFAGMLTGFGIDSYSAIMMMVMSVVCLVVMGVYIVINLLFVRKAHKFTKSLCVSAETGVPAFEKVMATRQWLFVMGVIGAVSVGLSLIVTIASAGMYDYYYYAYSGVTTTTAVVSLFSGGASVASYIVAAMWIKKYFTDC